MRVFLTGFMAAGKTTVGRELAARLDARFFDLDQVIEERAGASVAGLFARDGEEGFRRAERRALAALVAATESEKRVVVATGGGTMIDGENRRLMAASGRVVWLDPDFDVLSARLAKTATRKRPLFRDREQARRLFESRVTAYRQADLRLEIGARETAAAVAARVLDWLEDASRSSCDT